MAAVAPTARFTLAFTLTLTLTLTFAFPFTLALTFTFTFTLALTFPLNRACNNGHFLTCLSPPARLKTYSINSWRCVAMGWFKIVKRRTIAKIPITGNGPTRPAIPRIF